MASAERDQEDYVMVFPAPLLSELAPFQGLCFKAESYVEHILTERRYLFKMRSEAENDPRHKQLIPYLILNQNGKVLSYRRGKLTSERRLMYRRSIGIGGHVLASDPTMFATVHREALLREIGQEFEIAGRCRPRLVAVLNDDSNQVGRVHFGLVYVGALESRSQKAARPKEKSITQVRFLSVSDLKKNIDEYENWSVVCIRHIEELLLRAISEP